MNSSKLIDGENLTAFERWELPHMGDQSVQAKAREKEKNKDKAKQSRVEEVEVEEVQPLTAEQLAAIEEDARKEGYAKGLAKGEKAGLAAGKKQIDDAVRRLEKVIKALNSPLEQVNEAVEEELLALALAVARQVIRREIEQDPQHILAVIREAMAELPTAARQVRISLHPDDAELVRDTFVSDEDEERPWKILEDKGISRGGCRIESQTSRIDATVEKRLDTVIEALLGESPDEDAAQAPEAQDDAG